MFLGSEHLINRLLILKTKLLADGPHLSRHRRDLILCICVLTNSGSVYRPDEFIDPVYWWATNNLSICQKQLIHEIIWNTWYVELYLYLATKNTYRLSGSSVWSIWCCYRKFADLHTSHAWKFLFEWLMQGVYSEKSTVCLELQSFIRKIWYIHTRVLVPTLCFVQASVLRLPKTILTEEILHTQ